MKKAAKERVTLKARFLNLWRSRNSPHEIALGVAIGVFIGITPLYGFHIIMCFIAAIVMRRVNKMAIFLGVNISLPPTIPFITWAGYHTGRMVLGKAYPALGWEDFRHFIAWAGFSRGKMVMGNVAPALGWEEFRQFLYALFVGSFIFGIGVSVLFYVLTLLIFKRRRKTSGLRKESEVITCGGNGCHGGLL